MKVDIHCIQTVDVTISEIMEAGGVKEAALAKVRKLQREGKCIEEEIVLVKQQLETSTNFEETETRRTA